MSRPALKNILEAVLMAAGGPVSLERMQSLFDDHEQPKNTELKQALTEIKQDLLGRGIELVEVATGFRLQVRTDVAPWVARLWDEKPQRYSRALLETLALIAYRQPITRGDIEDVRGVVVSSQMMKTLIERDWVRIVGYRDVPGRPAMYATTKEFLDYFGLKTLEDLPSLVEIRELEDANRKLELGEDAEARKETPKEYDFSSDEDVEERGASVLDATEEDLAKAAALVDRVEANVFARPEEEDGEEGGDEKPRDLGDLLKRLETVEKDRDLSDLVADQEIRNDASQAATRGEGAEPEIIESQADADGERVDAPAETAESETKAEDTGSKNTAPKTLEDAQRARLLAEQQAIKDKLMAEIAAEQAALQQQESGLSEQPPEPEQALSAEVVDDSPADETTAAEALTEQELLEAEVQAERELLEAERQEREQQQIEQQLYREQELLEAEARAEAELLAEQQSQQQGAERQADEQQDSDDNETDKPAGPSLFG